MRTATYKTQMDKPDCVSVKFYLQKQMAGQT